MPLHPREPVGELGFLPCFGTLFHAVRRGPVTGGGWGEKQNLGFLQADHYQAYSGLNRIRKSSGLEWSMALIFQVEENGLTKGRPDLL